MRKCNVCGRKFRLLAKNRYEVVKSPVGLNCLTQGTVYYNAFDCPHCGCQNIVGVVEKVNVKDMENDAIKTVTNAEEDNNDSWMDIPVEEMSESQLRCAVKELRKKIGGE